MLSAKADLLAGLQSDILRLEGFKSVTSPSVDGGLGPIRDAFPNANFPLGAVHEFLSAKAEETAAATGFIAGLLASLMKGGGVSLWISTSRMVFPPALKNFGIDPDRIIFVDLPREKEVIWAVDEALKCSALTAVIAEMNGISFTYSRRLQLAVENSQVTGFLFRNDSPRPNATACFSRWRIQPLPSEPIDDLPGIGSSAWRVELLKIRNGRPGTWNIHWKNGIFQSVQLPSVIAPQQMKAG